MTVKQEASMRALAFGIIATVGIAMAVPAFADDVRVGVGVGGAAVGVHHDRDNVRVRHVRRDVTVGVGHRDRVCKTIVIHNHGVTKKIRRCR
jgi:hypothetical protein